ERRQCRVASFHREVGVPSPALVRATRTVDVAHKMDVTAPTPAYARSPPCATGRSAALCAPPSPGYKRTACLTNFEGRLTAIGACGRSLRSTSPQPSGKHPLHYRHIGSWIMPVPTYGSWRPFWIGFG